MSAPTRRLAAALLLAAAPAAPVATSAARAQTAPAGAPDAYPLPPRRTNKPPLHGRHWMAVTGKPLAASAGAQIFTRGGNAVDAACAMLAAATTMWDVLSWGGETQALIYNPRTRQVVGINALGVAPTGATPAFYRDRGLRYPPEFGPLAAVTPGTPGGLMTMLAEYGTMTLEQVLAPAIQMADGYPIEAQTATNIELEKARIKQWRYAPAVFLPHRDRPLAGGREAPEPGEIFRQPDLAATLRKLVEAERARRSAGKDRKAAIRAAYDRFYTGDIADEIVRGVREEGGLFTKADLANWRVKIERPVSVDYRGVTVYKLPIWQQGPAMLQALNLLEQSDLRAMGYNSPRYLHAVYQAMSLAFADRDFYYGDPSFSPAPPTEGLLSKAYARQRWAGVDWQRNDPNIRPGDPYPFQGGTNPFKGLLARWTVQPAPDSLRRSGQQDRVSSDAAASPAGLAAAGRTDAADSAFAEQFHAGTTSIEAADSAGWVVSITPSGGWVPAVIAGRTGVGLSQRAQSFVTRAEDGPYNVIAPGKQPRVTLTPTLAMRDGRPFLSFAVQGGDSQDQNLLQYFLNVVEWGMTPQQAAEAPNMNSYQMRSSFGAHESRPGRMLVNAGTPEPVRARCGGWATRWSSRRAPTGRSTPSGSTRGTARSGGPRRTTARTTGSGGRRRIGDQGSGIGGAHDGCDRAPHSRSRPPIPGPMPDTPPVPVRHRPELHRFTADVGADDEAVLAYEEVGGGVLDLQHTIVPPEARGEGVADALVRAAVDYARAHDVMLAPTCPYVAAWMQRHPRDADVFVGAGA
jgi:gamma-glutamyltranspeptidase/glutathione hydrolase